MAEKWEEFEIASAAFLTEHFKGIDNLEFVSSGKSDSNVPDIIVRVSGIELFSIEAKLSPAQSGQFVIVENDNKYELSKKNKNENKYSNEILKYINENYINYKIVTQRGLNLQLPGTLMVDWVKEHYKGKKSEFMITSTEIDGFKKILYTDQLEEYFDVTGTMRRKKSGSRHIAAKDFENGKIELEKHAEMHGLRIKNIDTTNKFIVNFFDDKSVNKNVGSEYFLSQKKDFYILRKKGNTNNVTVVFSLKYKGDKKDGGLKELENFIEISKEGKNETK